MNLRSDIPAGLDGERVDRVVALLTGVSRTSASDLINSGSVRLGGNTVATRSSRVGEGQQIEIDWVEPSPIVLQADPSVSVSVVHADDDVIVLDKAAGVVVHPGSGMTGGTLVQGLLAIFPEIAGIGEPDRPGIVHRIDKGTSGLLVVARSQHAYVHLSDQLARHTVERRYQALVWGHPGATAGLIDAPLGRSPRDPLRRAVVSGGKPARTRYRVVQCFDHPIRCALLNCELETGRTHQIRIHLRAIKHAVLGDQQYGHREAHSLPLERQWLHAAVLGFEHPASGIQLRFESPLPADLAATLAILR